MIRCKTCDALFYPGTLFCQECGDFLQDPAVQNEENPSSLGSKIHYLISGSGRQGKLDCNKPVWIGRADPDQGYWPQLDLTEERAVELGVSRRHALIQLGDQGPVLVDQSSTNGTWIDQEQLIPEKPYALPRVAQIRFGRLLLRTFLE
jgi:hypothetical protein